MKKNDGYFYYQDLDVFIQIKSDSVDEIKLMRNIETLFEVEYDWRPKIESIDGEKTIRQIGCGGYGCAYLTNNNKVVKFTEDRHEAIFALHLNEVTEYWPSIFVNVHKVYLSGQSAFLWKDYAVEIKEKDFLHTEECLRFLDELYQGDSDWRESLDLVPSIKQDRDFFDKLVSFGNEFSELNGSIGLSGSDLKMSNIGLSKNMDRLVIFDFGMFDIWPEPEINISYNKIIDLSDF